MCPVAELDALRPRGPREHPVVISDRLSSVHQSPRPHRWESRNEPPEAGSSRGACTPQAGHSLPVRSRSANPTGSWFTTHTTHTESDTWEVDEREPAHRLEANPRTRDFTRPVSQRPAASRLQRQLSPGRHLSPPRARTVDDGFTWIGRAGGPRPASPSLAGRSNGNVRVHCRNSKGGSGTGNAGRRSRDPWGRGGQYGRLKK